MITDQHGSAAATKHRPMRLTDEVNNLYNNYYLPRDYVHRLPFCGYRYILKLLRLILQRQVAI